MIDARRSKIEEGLESADKAERRLGEIEGERDTIIEGATHQADGILSTSKTRAEEQAGTIVLDANQRADAIAKQAKLSADEAKNQALNESRDEIAKVAILAAEKIMRKNHS